MASWNRNISMRALRAFCAAAEHESFSAAAQQLYLTASAVSHQIKHLETELGSSLFARSSRSLSLTEAGRALYTDLLPVLETLDEVTARHASASVRTSLKVSVPPFFASELFVPGLSEFSAGHPELDIDVDTSGDAGDAADASIRLFSSPPDSASCDRLFPVHLIPVSSPEFYDSVVVRGGRIVSDFPIIVHDSRPNSWRQWQRHSRIRVPSTAKTLRLDSMIAVARAAERGLGAALIPARLANGWLESQTLVQLFDHELKTKDAYYLVCNATIADNGALTAFRNWVLQEFALDE